MGIAKPCALIHVRGRKAPGRYVDIDGRVWPVGAGGAWSLLPVHVYQIHRGELERPWRRVEGFGRTYRVDRLYAKAGGVVLYARALESERTCGCGEKAKRRTS